MRKSKSMPYVGHHSEKIHIFSTFADTDFEFCDDVY